MTGPLLILSDDILQAMLDHLRGRLPEEACGLLSGVGGRARVVYPIDNILHSPVAYEMDPMQQIMAMTDMEERGEELLAIFHSHPRGRARPSETDIAQAYYPDTYQLIISLQDPARPDIRAFTIRGRAVAEVAWQFDTTI